MIFLPSDFGPGFNVQGHSGAGAVYSRDANWEDATYRYVLWRVWDSNLPTLLWCMLNPSTASHAKDDHTISKVRGFSERAGFGGLVVVNLFGLRSRHPQALLETLRPGGAQNKDAIVRVLNKLKPKTMVCGWGGGGDNPLGRLVAARAIGMYILLDAVHGVELTCLGTTKYGQPKHPLTLGYKTPRVAWTLPDNESDSDAENPLPDNFLI